MTDANRPWWADPEAVQFWCEQQQFDATLAYFDGLTKAIEHRIAYAAADPAVAASDALCALDMLWFRPKVVIGAWGGEAVRNLPEPLPFQLDDPARVMVCACTHPYTAHDPEYGCQGDCVECPPGPQTSQRHDCYCAGFKYSHDDDGSE
uniref:Uncharacterized protein n=1 Tax=Mycobacterium phage Pharb TaxID=3136626 RepID=A0AAU8GPP7_9VIRU